MKILFLSRWFPDPPDNGSKIRIVNLLRGLALHHDVTLLSFSDQPEMSRESSKVKAFCKSIHVIPWKEFNPYRWRALAGFFSLKPRSIVDTFSPVMAESIVRTLDEENFDVVIASQLSMAAYYPYFRNTPALFDELELGLAYEGSASSPGWVRRILRRFTWFKFHFYLSRLLKHIRSITVVSEMERELVSRNFTEIKEVTVVPNGIDVDECTNVNAEPQPHTIIFTGSFRYRVNYEAMVWFLSEVFPLALEKIPTMELIITGDHQNLPLPSQRNVRLAGYVDNVRSWIASSTIAIAPLLSGGGTRLKVLEAMALGTPVVATSKGAEGLNAVNKEHLLIADTPEEFAQCILNLMSDWSLAKQISANARQLVKMQYDWGAVMPQFLRLVEKTAVHG